MSGRRALGLERMGTCHTALVGVEGDVRVYAAILFEARLWGNERDDMRRERVMRSGTDEDCWLTTTLERTLRSEVTTAAHVSSAEDSRARTVNLRLRTQ